MNAFSSYTARWLVCAVALLGAAAMVCVAHSETNGQSKYTDAEPQLELVWSITKTFNQPESAVFDPNTESLFVSNVNGYALDGNGFVSRVSADGQNINLRWLDGLNSPTGLTVMRNKLLVVDYNELLVVDIASAKIEHRYRAPQHKPALNDVVVSADEQIFVSGSLSNTIYTVQGDALVVWLHDETLLKQANGLFISDSTLIFGGQQLAFFDLANKELLKMGPSSLVSIDGIASDGCGGFVLSLIDDSRLWRMSDSGRASVLSPEPLDGIDLHYFGGDLFVPRVGGGLSRFRLLTNNCNFALD